MPGFTAEAALTVNRPYFTAAASVVSRETAVYPQARIEQLRAPSDGGTASCKCPCCILIGGDTLVCC
jgi:hypothetical protein